MLSTKEEVYGYLEKISRNFSTKELKQFTANDIGELKYIQKPGQPVSQRAGEGEARHQGQFQAGVLLSQAECGAQRAGDL